MNRLLDLLPPAGRAFLRRHLFVWSTLYLLLILMLLVIFARLAVEIREQESLVTLDQQIADQFYHRANAQTDDFFSAVTLLGSQGVILLALAGAAYLAWRRAWVHFWVWAIAVGGGEALNVLVKDLFTRARPIVDVPILAARGYSFPSGHAMLSTVVYGIVAYFILLTARQWWQRAAVAGFFTLLILLIGLSRIVLVVHFFSDVLGGFLLGGAWLAAVIGVFERIRRRKAIRGIGPESLDSGPAPAQISPAGYGDSHQRS